jgi:hypothetical protein
MLENINRPKYSTDTGILKNLMDFIANLVQWLAC